MQQSVLVAGDKAIGRDGDERCEVVSRLVV